MGSGRRSAAAGLHFTHRPFGGSEAEEGLVMWPVVWGWLGRNEKVGLLRSADFQRRSMPAVNEDRSLAQRRAFPQGAEMLSQLLPQADQVETSLHLHPLPHLLFFLSFCSRQTCDTVHNLDTISLAQGHTCRYKMCTGGPVKGWRGWAAVWHNTQEKGSCVPGGVGPRCCGPNGSNKWWKCNSSGSVWNFNEVNTTYPSTPLTALIKRWRTYNWNERVWNRFPITRRWFEEVCGLVKLFQLIGSNYKLRFQSRWEVGLQLLTIFVADDCLIFQYLTFFFFHFHHLFWTSV